MRGFVESFPTPFHLQESRPDRFGSENATSTHLPFDKGGVSLPMSQAALARAERVVFAHESSFPTPVCFGWGPPPIPRTLHQHTRPGFAQFCKSPDVIGPDHNL